MNDLRVKVDDKYTVIRDDGGTRALRYDEEWRDLTGDGLVLAMAYRIEELEAQKAALLAKAEELRDRWTAAEDRLNIVEADNKRLRDERDQARRDAAYESNENGRLREAILKAPCPKMTPCPRYTGNGMCNCWKAEALEKTQ